MMKKEIWIATGNAHKVHEFEKMFLPLGWEVKSLRDLSEPIEIEETGETFEENAKIKAESLCKILNLPVVSDDSGLEIDAMNKEPGVHSARWMGHDTDYRTKNEAILNLMKEVEEEKRTCRFVCAIALSIPHHSTQVFTGTIEGHVAHHIVGENGFGYDPIFFVPELNKTLSELSDEEKNAISHRGKACKMLMEYILENEH